MAPEYSGKKAVYSKSFKVIICNILYMYRKIGKRKKRIGKTRALLVHIEPS